MLNISLIDLTRVVPSVLGFEWYTYVAAAVGLLTTILLGVLLYKYMEKTRKKDNTQKAEKGEEKPAAPVAHVPTRQLEPGLLKAVFRRGVRLLKKKSTTRDPLYDIPWLLMVGPPGGGKSTILSSLVTAGMKPDAEMAKLSRRAGCDWAFLNGGLVIELAGDYLFEEGDATSRKTGFGRFLKILRSYRKSRPLDGIILVLPAADLLKKGAHAEVERDSVGRKVLDRLQGLQRELGVRCPVYVIVSRCESIEGFGQFTKALPDGTTTDIIGWSNPYSLDATFRPEWYDEAFTSLESAVAELQLATLASGGQLPGAGELYLFRQNVISTRQAVTSLTSPLFKSTVYLEPFMFRGVYFSGNPDADVTVADEVGGGRAPAAPTPKEGDAQAHFVDKLFNSKILAETGLTKLGSRAYGAKLRGKRAVQVIYASIVVALLTGMAFATQRLVRASSTLRPVLNSMRGSVGQEDDVEDSAATKAAAATGTAGGPGASAPTPGSPEPAKAAGSFGPKKTRRPYSRSATVRLLGDMSELAYGKLKSVFLPSSYFSNIDKDIQSAVTKAYTGVLFPAFASELELRSQAELLPVSEDSKRQVSGATLEQTPAFAELRRRVSALKALQETAQQYNRFAATDMADKKNGGDSPSRSVAELGALTEKLLETPLPAGFYSNFEYHEEALKGAIGKAFRPEGFQTESGARALELVGAIFDSVFNATELVKALQAASDQINGFSTMQFPGAPEARTIEAMRALSAAITEADVQAKNCRVPMLLVSEYKPGAQFDALMQDIGGCKYFDDSLPQQLTDIGIERFDKARNGLYDTKMQGPFGTLLQVRMWSSSFALDSRVLMLRDALDSLVNADYMRVTDARPIEEAPSDDNQTLIWNLEKLQDARRVLDNYESVHAAGFNIVGPALSSLLLKLSALHAHAYMIGTISQAQQIEEIKANSAGGGEEDGSAEWQERELANFKRAEPIITPLITKLEEVGFDDVARDLRRVLFQQAGNLLNFADIALGAARPYGMAQRGFTWWNGEQPPALEAFGLTDMLELKPLVAAQRQSVRRLARDSAQPLVALLQGKPLSDILDNREEAAQVEETLERWVKLINSLKQQEAKLPGNSVDALESFILGDMTKVTLANCFDPTMLRDVPREPGEYFGDIRERLRYSIAERCSELAAAQARLEYDAVRREFEGLVNKFPFLLCPFDADPVKVKRALDLAGDFIKKHENTIKTNAAFNASRPELQSFIDKIKKINDFFSTTLAVDGQIPSLSFDAAVEFRINKALEVGANQVIDWKLYLNRFEVDLRSKPEDRYRWGLSDRVEISFRWAAQAPDQPTKEGLPGSARIDSGEVSYSYAGPWALLRLVRSHLAPRDMLENSQEPSHPLAFRIETVRSNMDKGDPEYGQRRVARLFARLELYSPTSKARLTLPEFPTCVPDIDSPGLCEGR